MLGLEQRGRKASHGLLLSNAMQKARVAFWEPVHVHALEPPLLRSDEQSLAGSGGLRGIFSCWRGLASRRMRLSKDV
jgi:hypothetical protein